MIWKGITVNSNWVLTWLVDHIQSKLVTVLKHFAIIDENSLNRLKPLYYEKEPWSNAVAGSHKNMIVCSYCHSLIKYFWHWASDLWVCGCMGMPLILSRTCTRSVKIMCVSCFYPWYLMHPRPAQFSHETTKCWKCPGEKAINFETAIPIACAGSSGCRKLLQNILSSVLSTEPLYIRVYSLL